MADNQNPFNQSNPFDAPAESSVGNNPFGAPEDQVVNANPFSAPSVPMSSPAPGPVSMNNETPMPANPYESAVNAGIAAAQTTAAHVAASSIKGKFSKFGKKFTRSTSQDAAAPQAAPASYGNTFGNSTGASPFENPSTFTSPSFPTDTTTSTDISSKMSELQRREAEVLAREKAVAARELQIQGGGGGGGGGILQMKPNFPKCFPVVYHNISKQVPEKQKTTVIIFYTLWIFTILCLILNFAGVVVWVAVYTPASDIEKVSAFFLALAYLAIGPPLAFFVWYFPLYQAVVNQSPFKFFVFFFLFTLHLLYCCFSAIGVPMAGAAGVTGAFLLFLPHLESGYIGNPIAGVFHLIIFFIWCVNLVLSVIMFIRAHRLYRLAGGYTGYRREAKSKMIANSSAATAAVSNLGFGANQSYTAQQQQGFSGNQA